MPSRFEHAIQHCDGENELCISEDVKGNVLWADINKYVVAWHFTGKTEENDCRLIGLLFGTLTFWI